MNALVADSTVEPSLNQCTRLKKLADIIRVRVVDFTQRLNPFMKKLLNINSSTTAKAANVKITENTFPLVQEN